MFFIAGLGNPGNRYAHTRHNIGWMVLDELARRHNIEYSKREHQALTATTQIGEQRVLVAKPQTWMNDSGRAVGALLRYNKIEMSQLLVVCDDLNLPTGKLRLRAGGSDGGQNGLKSVEQHLGSQNYARLRFGVGAPTEEERSQRGTADFVLSAFSPDETETVRDGITRAADCIETFIAEGLPTAMNRFNG